MTEEQGPSDEGEASAPTLEPIPAPSAEDLRNSPWRNPAQWEVWADREIQGLNRSFNHLLPFDMTLSRSATKDGKHPAMAIDIRVVFDCHVVTEAFNPQLHVSPVPVEETWHDASKSLRVYHADRFQLSQGLPQLIKDMTTTGKNPRCFETNRNNFMVLEKQGTAQPPAYYHVFFDLYRSPRPQGSGSRLILYVQSAYLKSVPMRNHRTDSTLFVAVCAKKMGL